jgi:hypothetical protein
MRQGLSAGLNYPRPSTAQVREKFERTFANLSFNGHFAIFAAIEVDACRCGCKPWILKLPLSAALLKVYNGGS